MVLPRKGHIWQHLAWPCHHPASSPGTRAPVTYLSLVKLCSPTTAAITASADGYCHQWFARHDGMHYQAFEAQATFHNRV